MSDFPPHDPTLPDAVLWDMDGTIVDTEPYWMASETPLVARFGGTWTHEQALRLVGLGLWDAATILQEAGVQLGPDEIVTELTDAVIARLRADGVPFRPGALELLRALFSEGTPQALVTMSIRRMALEIDALIEGSEFATIVAGDDVDRPKPFPDPYELAAARLGVDVRRCVAIEDSPNGVRSAVAAGCFVVGVPHFVSLDGEGADVLVASLADLSPARLSALFSARLGADDAGVSKVEAR
ncbi:HAD family phosphatase [uncultured Microbacterium sp.]|uniref:HAD family hydrolase n=1 Tax=uncultured Microbacterium sp. TaxID=191216 RepID=UPI0025D5E6B3|nr:HAD family phosphatase [uncultured Microbacterium sp.]